MAIGIGAKLARMLLFAFNIVFWLAGVGLIGVGVWLLVDESKAIVFAIVQVDAAMPMIKIGAYAVIGIGVFVFFVGILGCCGALHENRCMLVTYFSVILVILAAEVVGAILIMIYKNQLEQGLQDNMQKNLRENYHTHSAADPVTSGFNYAQYTFKCCGVRGPGDYNGSEWNRGKPDTEVPVSCCAANGKSYSQVEPLDRAACEDPNSTIPGTRYKGGCYERVKEFISSANHILIGVGIGIAILEMLGMLFAICLCRNIDSDYI